MPAATIVKKGISVLREKLESLEKLIDNAWSSTAKIKLFCKNVRILISIKLRIIFHSSFWKLLYWNIFEQSLIIFDKFL